MVKRRLVTGWIRCLPSTPEGMDISSPLPRQVVQELLSAPIRGLMRLSAQIRELHAMP